MRTRVAKRTQEAKGTSRVVGTTCCPGSEAARGHGTPIDRPGSAPGSLGLSLLRDRDNVLSRPPTETPRKTALGHAKYAQSLSGSRSDRRLSPTILADLLRLRRPDNELSRPPGLALPIDPRAQFPGEPEANATGVSRKSSVAVVAIDGPSGFRQGPRRICGTSLGAIPMVWGGASIPQTPSRRLHAS